MKVRLPDNSELELPAGATGLDAARAIGPKLAEQAVLVRSNGQVKDLRQPLDDGEQIQILTTRDTHGSRRALRPAPLDRAPARGGGAPPLPGREDRDRPADRERLLLRLRVPGADPRRGPGEDRGGDQPRAEGRPRVEPRGGDRGGSESEVCRRGIQTGARRHRGGRHHAVHPGRLHRPLPRPAPPELEADQGVEADQPRRRVLARRREEQAADPHLRHRVLRPEGSRRVPADARGGAQARPSPARRAARSLPFRRALARLAVLAPEGDGDLERARGPAPPRERAARLRRGEDAADLRQSALGDLGPLGEVPREHVPDPARRRARLRDQADELPRAHAPLRERAPQLPRAAPALRGGRAAAPQRAAGALCTGSRASATSPRTTRTSSARREQIEDEIFGCLDYAKHLYDLFGLEPRAELLDPAGRTSSAPTRSGTSPRARSRAALDRRRILEYDVGAGEARSTGRRSTCT